MRFLSIVAACFLCAGPRLHSAQAAEGSCDPEQIQVASTPVLEQSPYRLKRAFEKARLDASNADLMLIGDSLSDFWQAFQKTSFPTRRVYNFGVAGDKTQEVLWRLDNARPERLKPSDIVLLIGTNNLSDLSSTPCGVAAGITAVADKIALLWPDASIFVIAVLPRGEGFQFRLSDRKAANAILSEHYATSKQVAVVEIPDDELTCGTAASSCKIFKPDLLHLDSDGYRIVAQAIQRESMKRFGRAFRN